MQIQDVGLRTARDPEILEWCAIRRTLPTRLVIEDLTLVAEASTPEDWDSKVYYLPL